MENSNLYQLSKEILERKTNILVGNKNIRKELDNIYNLIFTSMENKDELNFLDINGNILLYGPPGFGKTSIIYEQMLKAKEDKYEVYHLNISSLISEKMGKTSKAIDDFFKKIIEETNKYKVIILIEEIEVFLPDREGEDHNDMKRALTVFMHYLDSNIKNLIVFCTTNHIDMLDKAIQRRFAFRYEIHNISKETIIEFLNHRANPFKNKFNNSQKQELSELMSNKKISFSDIKLIMRKVYVKNKSEIDFDILIKEIE